ncbi:MAG: diguanylate cyclase [Firmicutes bacterium]|nr:diguanylate cyclase [Bacillota bacterium]
MSKTDSNERNRKRTFFRYALLVDVLTKEFNSSQEQLDYALNQSLKLTESEFGYIYLYNEKDQVFTLNSWSEDVMDECKITKKQTVYQLEKTGIWGEAVRQRKPIIVNDFKKPHPFKKGYPEGHVKLLKYMTVPIIIDGKIMAVIGLANKEDDYDDTDIHHITALMTGVWHAKERREREIELEKVLYHCKEHKDRLQLILDSTVEAIFGIDNNGNCTFCNASFLKIMGYKHQNELIGKNMHYKIHHSNEDGTPLSSGECEVCKAFTSGKGSQIDDIMLWRADGTGFYAQLSSYPKYKEGKIVGGVITFTDITERKKAEDNIRYLSYHDPLTGLYNRMFFREERKRMDVEKNLPISIIVGDLNGLKLINDVFGHVTGDRLLRKASKVLKRVCRKNEVISRIGGGDEFAILLPKTTLKEAEGIISRIKREFSKETILAFRGSIAVGCDTKTSMDQDILVTMKNAENKMYLEKTLNRDDVSMVFLRAIIGRLHKNSPKEKEHSKNVSELSAKVGKRMGLPEEEIKRLKETGFLHDIGKAALNEDILRDTDTLADQDTKEARQHPAVGYRILNLFDSTLDLAEIVLAHHENWDGSGFPKGLKGKEIPRPARILRITSCFEAMTNKYRDNAISKEDALWEIQKDAGTKYDPDIVRIFIEIMQGTKD